MNKFFAGQYDLVLLDVMLPKLDGIEVCQRIREKSNVPIIMLTAKGDDMDKILGLEYGADDYMTKAVQHPRGQGAHQGHLPPHGDDAKGKHPARHHCARYADQLKQPLRGHRRARVNLTAKEFDLLQLFVTNRGKVFSRENLLETIWKYDYLGDLRTVDVHIRRLREKIERVPSQPEYIFTKWGVGYYFTDKD